MSEFNVLYAVSYISFHNNVLKTEFVSAKNEIYAVSDSSFFKDWMEFTCLEEENNWSIIGNIEEMKKEAFAADCMFEVVPVPQAEIE